MNEATTATRETTLAQRWQLSTRYDEHQGDSPRTPCNGAARARVGACSRIPVVTVPGKQPPEMHGPDGSRYSYGVPGAERHVDAAIALARGSYQQDILLGRESLSGATLAGKAASYGARYAESRTALLARMSEANIPWCTVTGVHGQTVLVIGSDEPAEHWPRVVVGEDWRPWHGGGVK